MNQDVEPPDQPGSTIVLLPASVTLAELERVANGTGPVLLDRRVRPNVDRAAQLVEQVAAGHSPVYGINTGFGKLSSVRIAASELHTLQRNLILSHCSGIGEFLPPQVVRLVIVLKLLSLGRGASGVRWQVIESLEALLRAGIVPAIPSQGSVGASGDLAPLAHLAAVLIGEGRVLVNGDHKAADHKAGNHKPGDEKPAGPVLAEHNIEPVQLGAKEGLALINGTQVSTALALVALFEAWRCARAAVVVSAMSTDAIMGSTAPLTEQIHQLRGHPGQIDVADAMRHLMNGSQIRESHREHDTRVQDPYCIRCQPQVTGACIDLLRQAGATLQIEANAVTDNPLVLTEQNAVLSGGNFHAEPVAFAADQIALAIAEIGSIAQRRVALMVDPTLSFDLPPFLTPDPGLNSGFMVAEITTAALMSENKHLANPCSTDSTPTSANQEDHVSMATHGARRLGQMTRNLAGIVGVELLCAARGIEFRAPLKTSPLLQLAIDRLRRQVSALNEDRFLAPDIAAAADLVAGDHLTSAAQCNELTALGVN